jgi:hypothetical protein
MGPSAVVEGQIPADPGAGLGDAGIGTQVDLLIFDALTQTLDEDVAALSPLAIHADLDLSGGPQLDEVLTAQDALLSVKRRSEPD